MPKKIALLKPLHDGPMEFSVVTVSVNRNSFGLRGMIVVARDGAAFRVAANDLNVKKRDDRFVVEVTNGVPDFSKFGWEVPCRVSDAPNVVVDQVFQA